MKKRTSILLIACLIIWTLSLGACAKEATISYAALGDSIAVGLQPNGEKLSDGCYTEIVKNYVIKEAEKPVELKNYAISGQTTAQLLEQLNKEDISNNDIITVSIGSNDVLYPCYQIIKSVMGETDSLEKEILNTVLSARSKDKEAIAKIQQLTDAFKDNDIMNQAINEFEHNYGEILKMLRDKNPNAKIVVTNIYNPFDFVSKFGLKGFVVNTNAIMDKLNSIINNIAEKNDCMVADVSGLGKNTSYLNITLSMSDLQIDPHPNQAGHKKIAKAIINKLK